MKKFADNGIDRLRLFWCQHFINPHMRVFVEYVIFHVCFEYSLYIEYSYI